MTIIELSEELVLDYLDQLAGLRLTIFREYPYLYDGQLEDEHQYLAGYAAQGGDVLLALDGEQVAGAITGLPLMHESAAFVEPFHAAGLTTEQYFYIGELLLLPPYRNLGWGSQLLARLEQRVAHRNRYQHYCLATVVRPTDHPLRPNGYIPIERFCQRHGYRHLAGVCAHVPWREVDGQTTTKTLGFWCKDIPHTPTTQ